MKKLMLLLAVLVLSAFTFKKQGLTRDDKTFLINHFQETKANVLKSIDGLSDAQLQYKASPERWSINECMEHIALTEKGIFEWQQSLIKQPANPEKRKDMKMKDEDVAKGVENRTKKAQAPDFAKPKGTFATTADAVQAFTTRRDQTIEYVKTTNDDLRNHITDHPAFGVIDAYQVLLLISAHSARHTKQIEEVKADAGFPKN